MYVWYTWTCKFFFKSDGKPNQSIFINLYSRHSALLAFKKVEIGLVKKDFYTFVFGNIF